MPHDKNGKPLKKGDRVTMEFEVESISEGETACNVTLKAVEDDSGEYRPQVSCNSKLTKLLSLAAWLAACFLPVPADAGCYYRPTYRAAIIKAPLVQVHTFYPVLGQLRTPVYAPPVQQVAASAQQCEPTARDFFAILRENANVLGLAAAGSGPPTLNPPPGYPPGGGQLPAPVEPPPAGPSNELTQLRGQVRQLVNAKCVQCHTANGPKLSLDSSIVVDLTRDDTLQQLACVVMAEVVGGTMPKDQGGRPAPLDNPDIGLVVRWEKAERLAAAQQLRTQPQQQPQPQPQPGPMPPPAPGPGAGGR